MPPAPIPANEKDRLAALHRYRILDTPSEQAYDDITRLASYICQAPIAVISFIDLDRQWFKAKTGLAAPETHRDRAFCAYTIFEPSLLVVPDAAADARFSDNPLVTHQPRIRFYAGAPLLTSDNYALGSLCVIDHQPRQLTAEQEEALECLSRQVISQLEFRRVSRRLAQLVAAGIAPDDDGPAPP